MQKPGEKRIAGAQQVIDFDSIAARHQPVLQSPGCLRKDYATPGAAFAHDDGARQATDMANGLERIFTAGRDLHFFLGSNDQIAIGQHVGKRTA